MGGGEKLNRKELNAVKINQTLRENGLSDNDELTVANIRNAVTKAILESNETYKEETIDHTIGKLLGKFE